MALVTQTTRQASFVPRRAHSSHAHRRNHHRRRSGGDCSYHGAGYEPTRSMGEEVLSPKPQTIVEKQWPREVKKQPTVIACISIYSLARSGSMRPSKKTYEAMPTSNNTAATANALRIDPVSRVM